MNPGAIYSKSGKGVQEASGKTSLLKRAERAVLSAIDGRATLNEVAQKVGKPFDGAFQSLIAQLDRDGFVREVTAGGSSVAPAPAKPAAKPAKSKAAAPAPGDDLDFTGVMPIPAAPAKPAVDPATALFKARKEAEERAAEERERLRAEAEAKARAEAETKAKAEAAQKMREEAAARARAEAEAKLKAAAEAKARAEAEAKAKIEAERKAREEAERKAREEAERARREAEELRQRLEEERRAREEAERRAKEEAERKAREEAERKAREEAERKAREEAERARREAEELRQRLEEERRAREEAERKAQEEAERARQEAERKAQEEAERARQEAERKARAEQEAQMRRAREEAERKRAEAARKREEAEARKGEPLPEITPPPAPLPQAPPAKAGGEGLDALMADLDSFTQREDQDRKASEEAENRTTEARKRKLQEEGERRAREQADKERRDAEARQREAQERREQEHREREQAEQRARDEADRQRREAEERARQARESMSALQAQDSADDIGVTDDDLDMDDVRRDEAAVAKESRKARREREREQRRLEKEARERAKSAEKAAARQAKAKARASAKGEEAPAVKVKVRRPRKWGKPVALTLFILLVAGIGLLHVMPVPVQDYQQAASEALRQPVRIGEARLSLYKGLQLNLRNVRIGEATRIGEMRAFPQLGSLASPVKAFERIELDGVTLRQDALDESLSASARGPNFRVERILIKDLKLEGPLPLPPLEADVRMAGDGSVRTVLVRGPEGLMGQLMPKAGTVDFDVTAGSFTVPFAQNLALSSFAMKGRATRQGMRIESWGGSVLGGALSGTASLRWGGTWQLDGVLTVRGINAAVLAPALLSEGHAEGTGKFAMSGSDPGTLVRSGRVEGNFTIGKGVLGSFDLARAIRTEGREVNGRTPFVELNGLGVYDKGAVALRNVVIGAGALQAGASADISQSGALSGRIVADVRTASQSLRATLLLGGTVKDPQVRN